MKNEQFIRKSFEEHLAQKRVEFENFMEGLKELRVSMEAQMLHDLEIEGRRRKLEQLNAIAEKALSKGIGKFEMRLSSLMEESYILCKQ